jgi:hypothetical protein
MHLALDRRVTCSKRLPGIKATLDTLLARTDESATPDIAPLVATAVVIAPNVIAIFNTGPIATNKQLSTNSMSLAQHSFALRQAPRTTEKNLENAL